MPLPKLNESTGNPDLVLVRTYHSLEAEFGYLAKFGCVEIASGICWLAAAVRGAGHRVAIIDALPLHLSNAQVVEQLTARPPRWVGITACTMEIDDAADLAARLKRVLPGVTVIIGGAHVSAVPEETMRRYPAFDFGVVGEGEATIVELLDALSGRGPRPLAQIDGLIVRAGEMLTMTKPRALLPDLDALPLPAWDLLPDLRTHYFAPPWTMHNGRTTTIITSRGCPFQCIYCDRTVFGNRVRFHSPEYTVNLMRTMHENYGISHFRIADDNFMIPRERLVRTCELLLAAKLGITWSCLARVDAVTEEILALMKRAGCWSIAFGVETGSQRIHDLEKKDVTLEQIAASVSLTRKAGIKTISFNIIGHPTETEDDIRATIEFNKRIGIDDFKTQFMVPFPGTELYREADRYGTLDREWSHMGMFKDPVFVPHGLTREKMIAWNKRGFNSFYLQPRVIMAYLAELRSFAELRMLLVGGLTLLGWKLRALRPDRERE